LAPIGSDCFLVTGFFVLPGGAAGYPSGSTTDPDWGDENCPKIGLKNPQSFVLVQIPYILGFGVPVLGIYNLFSPYPVT